MSMNWLDESVVLLRNCVESHGGSRCGGRRRRRLRRRRLRRCLAKAGLPLDVFVSSCCLVLSASFVEQVEVEDEDDDDDEDDEDAAVWFVAIRLLASANLRIVCLNSLFVFAKVRSLLGVNMRNASISARYAN